MIVARCEKPWAARQIRDALSGPVLYDLPGFNGEAVYVECPVYVWEDDAGHTVEVGRLRVVE